MLPTQAARDKADSSDPGSVGAPMAGEIIEVKAKPGSFVKAGQVSVATPLFVPPLHTIVRSTACPCLANSKVPGATFQLMAGQSSQPVASPHLSPIGRPWWSCLP